MGSWGNWPPPPTSATAAGARFSWGATPALFPAAPSPALFSFAATPPRFCVSEAPQRSFFGAPAPPPARRASTDDAPEPFAGFCTAPPAFASAATAASASDDAGSHLDVGDTVCLSDGYAAFGDARRGMLSPGESGLVAAQWTGSGTVCVSFRRFPESAVARTWFYERGALRRTAAAGAAERGHAAAAGGGAASTSAATPPPASTAAFGAAWSSEASRSWAAASVAAAAAATAAVVAANAAAVISLKPLQPAPSSSSSSPAPRLIVVPGARNSAHAVLNVGLLAASLLPASRGGGAWRLDIAVEACAPHAQHASGRNARRLAIGVAIGPSCASLLDDMRSTDTVGQGDGHFAIAQSVGRHGQGPPCAELVTSGETVRTGLPPLASGDTLSFRLLRRSAGEQLDATAAASAAADTAAAGAGDTGYGYASAAFQRFAFSPPATPTGDGLFLEIARPGLDTEVLPLGEPGGDEQVFVVVTAPAGTRLAITPHPLPAEPPAAAAAALPAGNDGAAPPAAAAVAADVADAVDSAPAVAAAAQQSAAPLRSPHFPGDEWAFTPQRQRRSFSAPAVAVRDKTTAARPNLDKIFSQLRRDVAAAVAQRRESDIAAFGEGTQSDRFRIDVNREPGCTLLADSSAALGPPGSPAWVQSLKVKFLGLDASGVDQSGCVRRRFAILLFCSLRVVHHHALTHTRPPGSPRSGSPPSATR